jgi:putative heme-binding domain-containing protein
MVRKGSDVIIKKFLRFLIGVFPYKKIFVAFMVTGIFWAGFLFKSSNTLLIQAAEAKNPHEGNVDAVIEGKQLFSVYCVFCHGTGGRGVKGPNLTDEGWKWGGTDADVFQTISQGRPGTGMGAFLTPEKLKEDQVWKVIAYIRSQATYGDWAKRYPSREGPQAPAQQWKPPAGITPDPKEGESLFKDANGKAACINCHIIDNQGGKVGPDLSHIGDRAPEYLLESIQNPSAYINPEFVPVQIAVKGGKRVIGIIKHEDDYSIQVRNAQDESLIFSKSEIQGTVPRNVSLMPTVNLTDQELYNVVGYLLTLK